RSPARRPPPQAGLAVGVSHRPGRRGGGRVLAGVLAPVRPGAHLPPVQAGTRLDRAEDPRPARRRPVDLADPRRLRPAPPRPAAGGGRPPPARTGSPPPKSAADSAASAPQQPPQPARRNPASPAPAAHPDPRTATRPAVTTWKEDAATTRPTSAARRRQVKRQA